MDMQLLAAQQGQRLLYAHLEKDAGSHATDRPASALFVHSRQKIACLTIRGTATIHDVVTDIRAMPVPFPEVDPDAPSESNDTCEDDWTPIFRGHGLALCGMAKASANLFRENIDTLLLLAQKGYRIRITGHSLGGGVAALLGALVLRHFEKNARQGGPLAAAFEKRAGSEHAPGNNASETNGISNLLRVYGYGTPSCVDAALSDYVRSFVTTVVMHDDVIPRLTPTSIRGLLKHLLHIRETWVKAHFTNDLMAITERARGVWAPRWRGSFTLLKSPSRLKGYYKKKILISKRKLQSLGTSSPHDQNISSGERVNENRADHDHVSSTSGTLELTCGTAEKEEQVSNAEDSKLDDEEDEVSQDTTGIYIDGEEFFEAEDTLVESDDESLEGNRLEDNRLVGSEQDLKSDLSNPFPCNGDSWNPFGESGVSFGESLPSSDAAAGSISRSAAVKVGSTSSQQRIDDSDGEKCSDESLEGKSIPAVVLEEAPLPRMFLPGKIVHIYTHRGSYKATYVPRAFRELRRISLAGNMLNDHISKAYYEGLLEVQSVRKAAETLPHWTGFAEDSTCSCCASLFTWASTSDSEAQAARDKHNCRSCGTLVCDPCSKNRLPLPSLGITVPVRVCDRCYNDIGGALTGDNGNGLARSFIANADAGDGNVEFTQTTVEANEPVKDRAISDIDRASKIDEVKAHVRKSRPQRQRQRRSIVVDELASRIHPSVPSH
uniref:sn-1-specific diacylglycerol lipase n=1 Tax=Attheya septentrionalis TaxID=420275 RepID=A0A7S2XR53_9STRA|mmetsp:Transcript_28410/g.51771  ORF Transcript_28410/g.51771 Transcript_28410/m.51771 type:complete len:721 (+) Transcript_28410:1066-3228(+)